MIENDGSVVAALSVFLLARITEREAAARKCAEVYPPPWDVADRGHTATVRADEPNFWVVTELEQSHDPNHPLGWLGDYVEHIARHDPARVLAECAAQRAIIEGDYWERNDGYVGIEVIEDVFRFLALPDADHPDYHEEWKPW